MNSLCMCLEHGSLLIDQHLIQLGRDFPVDAQHFGNFGRYGLEALVSAGSCDFEVLRVELPGVAHGCIDERLAAFAVGCLMCLVDELTDLGLAQRIADGSDTVDNYFRTAVQRTEGSESSFGLDPVKVLQKIGLQIDPEVFRARVTGNAFVIAISGDVFHTVRSACVQGTERVQPCRGFDTLLARIHCTDCTDRYLVIGLLECWESFVKAAAVNIVWTGRYTKGCAEMESYFVC